MKNAHAQNSTGNTELIPPCVDCICLPICKCKVDGGDMISLICLSDKCTLLRSFIYPKCSDGYQRVKLVEDFYIGLGCEYNDFSDGFLKLNPLEFERI
jgi:hypothetical protein